MKVIEISGMVSSKQMKCLEQEKIAAASERCLKSQQANSVFQKSLASEIDSGHVY